ncbi:hypothetical protein LTR62_006241 [Meristemomyces frigidus]|uniref:SUR7 protein n=1 Tax=Meristemomyces frigidus TaxID=1508187 RepID=A0AAN7YIN5_9PEZI|nr:hypothetical protein LTR62_006241 [Meristemomyces frigidus]
MFGRKKRADSDDLAAPPPNDDFIRDSQSGRTLTNPEIPYPEPSKAQIKRATRTRLIWALFTSFLLLITVVFLILVEVGTTSLGSTKTNIYFIKLDLSNIIPLSVPNAALVNSIARTLGLHDFYTVGLWGYCEGYNGDGFTDCSKPETLFWFNPVSILQSQLLAGATIALPASITQILSLIRIVSHWMFGLFLAGACLSFVLIPLLPLAVLSRWASLPMVILSFLAALCTTVAAVIATVLFIITQRAVTAQKELNIGAKIGIEMFVFMWIAAGAAILAWLVQFGLCCCCASRRDVRRGKKRGSKKAWTEGPAPLAPVDEKAAAKRGWLGRRNA